MKSTATQRWARLWIVARTELGASLRRPMLWILILILALASFGLCNGNLTISSGDTSVGGAKAWINSQYALSKIYIFLGALLYCFFAAVLAGTCILKDDELGTSELLHSTPLRPAEYVWGKFSGVLLALVLVMGLHAVATLYFFQFFPIDNAEEIRGPLHLGNYLLPMLLFVLPIVLFFAATAFAVGERTRRAVLIFVVPTAVFLLCVFFFWQWSPSWLDPRVNRLLMLLDPSAFRWLEETWLKVDRGVDYYNTEPVGLDWIFWANRLWVVLVSLGGVALSVRHCRRVVAGEQAPEGALVRLWRGRRRTAEGGPARSGLDLSRLLPADLVAAEALPLAALRMGSTRPGFLAGAWQIGRAELRELRNEAALFLFVPLILLQVLGTALAAVGAFDTPVLLTSGTLAVRTMNSLTLLVCLLLLFYTVESLERERATGFAPLLYSAPVRSASILCGKALADAVLGSAIVLAAGLGCAIALAVQGRAPLQLWPFALVWGGLLLPTFLLWGSFVTALLALVRERFTTYALALAALAATGYFQATGKMTWVWNWSLWSAVQWSDMGALELDRRALFLNRLVALSAAALLLWLSVRLFGRQERDAIGMLDRLRPRRLLRALTRIAPLALVPIVAGTVLAMQVRQGFEGKVAERREKNYWRKNLITWRDAPLPAIASLEIELELEPAASRYRTRGVYTLRNDRQEPLRSVPFTGSWAFEDLEWTLGGRPHEPEDRAGLYVFELDPPLLPGATIEVGFRNSGTHPSGPTKNGGGTEQFILESGVVLHSFTPSFMPILGFVEGIGVDDENRYEPRDYPDDFWKEQLEPALGTAYPFTTRVSVTAPREYTVNSVGELVEERVVENRRTVVWQSDYPVKLLNVVAGKWEVRRAGGTAVYYHPGHGYNIDEISDALQQARRYYSEWFYPYPWKELKLSEFPALASYAQGFPTNITFSEGIGFLTKSDPRSRAAFLVTAHEAAHQWWGNLVTPGQGPGGDILSEGMSHYSTILLFDQVLGEHERIELCKRLEERYGDSRQVDSERPLVEIDGTRAGDTTVTYDKGGWVMWMLTGLIGREQALAGLQHFAAASIPGPDYPVLQDLVEALRPYAPDAAAYQAFVDQWFFDVVVPEYKLTHTGTEHVGELRRVTVTVENRGTGRVPIEVALERGERFPEPDARSAAAFRDARGSVVLGAGERANLTLEADFEPERAVVDPDARVLQLRREAAVLRF